MLTLIVALGISQASYTAETVRASLMSVDRGQYEAAISVNMSPIQAMNRIVLPQAFGAALPNLFNSFVGVIKGTSLGFTIGVIELMSMSRILGNKFYSVMESYVAVLIIYWVLIAILEQLEKRFETRINEPYIINKKLF